MYNYFQIQCYKELILKKNEIRINILFINNKYV